VNVAVNWTVVPSTVLGAVVDTLPTRTSGPYFSTSSLIPPDAVIDPTNTDTTHPMGEVAAGVGAVIKRAYVDFGYRYRKAFHSGTPSFDISQVGASVGVKF